MYNIILCCSLSLATLKAFYWNAAKRFNDTYHKIHVTQPNYSLLIIISFTVSQGTCNIFFLSLWRSALQFVRKHFSVLNDISLWADNWHDSVDCDKLKVLSNYADSHRHVKVSASLSGATPMMRQPPIIESKTPSEENRLRSSPDSSWLVPSFCWRMGTCFDLGFVSRAFRRATLSTHQIVPPVGPNNQLKRCWNYDTDRCSNV